MLPELTTVVNQAASQNDRWFAMAMVCLLIISTIAVVRWLVGRVEKSQEIFREMYETQKSMAVENAKIIEHNTAAFNKVVDALGRIERINKI